MPRRVGPLRVGVLEANPRSRAALADADVAEADAIILAGTTIRLVYFTAYTFVVSCCGWRWRTPSSWQVGTPQQC